MCDAAVAIHENDMLFTGKADITKPPQQSEERDPSAKVRDDLPTKFLGLKYKRSQQGELKVDCQHYIENMRIPDSKQFAKLAKQDLLSNELQTIFNDITSKVNALAYTVRPDMMLFKHQEGQGHEVRYDPAHESC